jgi:hypothetical protein
MNLQWEPRPIASSSSSFDSDYRPWTIGTHYDDASVYRRPKGTPCWVAERVEFQYRWVDVELGMGDGLEIACIQSSVVSPLASFFESDPSILSFSLVGSANHPRGELPGIGGTS